MARPAWSTGLVVAICVVGCEPGPRSTRAPAYPLYVEPSESRADPQRVWLLPPEVAEVKVHARRAGAWWYVVDASMIPDGGRMYVSTTYDGPPGLVAFAIVDSQGERTSSVSSSDANKATIEVPARPARFLVRVTTKDAVKFRLFASYRAD